jgi:hypothetical protein
MSFEATSQGMTGVLGAHLLVLHSALAVPFAHAPPSARPIPARRMHGRPGAEQPAGTGRPYPPGLGAVGDTGAHAVPP